MNHHFVVGDESHPLDLRFLASLEPEFVGVLFEALCEEGSVVEAKKE